MAPTLDIELTITRTELSLADLVIGPANGYSIIKEGVGPGQQSWRKLTTSSPWIGGTQLIHAVKESPQMPVNIRVTGTSHANLWSRMATLTNAFSQFEYDLIFEIEGVTFTWEKCQPADYSIGQSGAIDGLMIRSLKQEVRFLVDRGRP